MRLQRIVILSILLISIWACTPDMKTKKVFVVFSYHQEYTWDINEKDGLNEAFEGQEIQVERFYMDTKRKTSSEWKQKVADSVIKLIDTYKPDVLIVFDDNACEYVAKHYKNTELPVVFGGMNKEPSYYGFPSKNITGCIERIPFDKSVEFLKELKPTVQNVALISDKSPTSIGMLDEVMKLKIPVKLVSIITTNDFGVWKQKIKNWQDQVDAIGILTYNTILDTLTGESMIPDQIMQWTVENNKLPEFASLDFTVYDGALCGVFKSGTLQGKTAGLLALEILHGTPVSDLKIINPQESTRLLNSKRAQQLGIDIKDVHNCEVIK